MNNRVQDMERFLIDAQRTIAETQKCVTAMRNLIEQLIDERCAFEKEKIIIRAEGERK